ncbi:MAG TPA: hypothetical protein VEH56_07690 [Candidatus Saccharimonadales bacterium]|nr:hypothetical protein [Candidatus Saccharimonadales bacterium]
MSNGTIKASKDRLYFGLIAGLTIAVILLAALLGGRFNSQINYVTQNNYVTVTNIQTQSIWLTVTQPQLQTSISTATSVVGPPGGGNYQLPNLSNPACQYPFNPYGCNEGPPVTITGFLSTSGSCTFLSPGGGPTYAVWNLPSNYTSGFSGVVQVYGFIYPNWPAQQPFPPYPFLKQSVCIGTPMWAVYPYIQTGV